LDTVSIDAGQVANNADLTLPASAQAVVLFAHGSGSSRHSSRNRMVAQSLNNRGLGTLLIDLLTEDEERADMLTGHLRFDIGLLSERLSAALIWLRKEKDLVIGLFGASTGAAAALVTAAEHQEDVRAVVSRGGRPDLAGEALARVRAPTLLIVGSLDYPVIGMNESAAAQMPAEHRIVIVEGASHLFEEPGKLIKVAKLSGDWFMDHL
jgi:putative phosphoribosyl transferase